MNFEIINELVVSDIEKAINFYVEVFEFEIEYTDGSPISWVQLKKDNVRLMLENYENVNKEIVGFPPKTKSANLIKFEYENYGDFKKIYEKCNALKIKTFLDYRKTEYGKIEFGILDADDNMILVTFTKLELGGTI